jgi:NDP-sugar pyrophosphorylase family protein
MIFYIKTMSDYRPLTLEEIDTLSQNDCWAEDWERVMVADGFRPYAFHRVMFYGDIRLGEFEKMVAVSEGFNKHSGINNATLRNVTIGDNCLIENVHNYIHNYDIGDETYISNVCTIETTEGATYGDGQLVSVLNEAGEGNVVAYHGLTSQLAALMVRHSSDKLFRQAIHRLISEEVRLSTPERGMIGSHVKIINTQEITNTVVQDDCEVNGATSLVDCSILSSLDSSVYIGNGVILRNTLVTEGSSVTDGAHIEDSFLGEATKITGGFSAESSLFFVNSYMSNGEACAAFCGPFSASHHKSTLLIGGAYSFYNAGSNTNFSNHAYKMGPIHYGTLERGSKTASGSHILWPAHIGTFSVCLGKIATHPDTRSLPFSYVIGSGDALSLVPGRNLVTVGLYRDVHKWARRDMRVQGSRKSLVTFDFLSPLTVGEIGQGKRILQQLQQAAGPCVDEYCYRGYHIRATALRHGIAYYDMALHMYMGCVIDQAGSLGDLSAPVDNQGEGHWTDLMGLLLPDTVDTQLVADIKDGTLDTIQTVDERLQDAYDHYADYQYAWAYRLILDYYGIQTITDADAQRISSDGAAARSQWLEAVRADAQKEFDMGGVDQETLEATLESIQ